MADAETRLTVRLPADLAAALRTRAAAEQRSLNSEIVVLLRQALASERTRAEHIAALPRHTLRPTRRTPRGQG
jgi:plasmid stability protein